MPIHKRKTSENCEHNSKVLIKSNVAQVIQCIIMIWMIFILVYILYELYEINSRFDNVFENQKTIHSYLKNRL